MDLQLNDDCKTDLLHYARETIGHELQLTSKPVFNDNWPVLHDQLGLFVTLTINGELRGCIGYIESQTPVKQALGELALSAAFRDPRFPPLSADEYSHIEIEITLLSKPEKTDRVEEIEIGRHGLIISSGYHRGLLLPQVAVEHHMDRNEFLEHTCRKAGLSRNAWQNADTTIETFEGYIFSEK